MNPDRRRHLQTLALGMIAASGGAQAQGAYPTRPVKIIVPFPAGQTTDILGRLVGEHLTRSLGQPFVVENRVGAGAIIGMEAAARAEPDGYTLLVAGSGPLGINPTVYSNLPYDPLKHYTLITNLGMTPQVLVVSPTGPYASVQDFVAAARANPGGLTFGSAGSGSTQHMTMEMLRSRLGLNMVHAPYKGSPASVADVMGGHIAAVFDSVPAVLANIKSGKLRALAVSSAERSPFLPDVPTISETVSPGFAATAWIALAAPAGVLKPIVDRIHDEVVKMLQLPEVKARLESLAFTPVGDSPEQFRNFVEREIGNWRKTAQDAGVKLD